MLNPCSAIPRNVTIACLLQLQHGLRSNFELEIVELKKDGLVRVGSWTELSGVNFTRNFTESYTEIVESLQNKTLIVTTIFVSIFYIFAERITWNSDIIVKILNLFIILL